MASNKYSLIGKISLIEGKTLYCRLKSKPYQRKIIPIILLISENQKNRALEKVIFSKVPGVDSNLRINSTSHCVFSDATKLNLVEGVFEK
ncbi:hypothetical protein Avbf_12104 [Armadillidium vulgare]|nr:hypothetical protein Avbf_12104 [Armadillidium vulgare]